MEAKHLLTHRELEVLHLMACSRHNKEIAHILNISEHTAKFHVNSILLKTKQYTRLGAVIYCLKHSILLLENITLHNSTPETGIDVG
jgi:DNA-binding NarL/FixJ family response regulator